MNVTVHPACSTVALVVLDCPRDVSPPSCDQGGELCFDTPNGFVSYVGTLYIYGQKDSRRSVDLPLASFLDSHRKKRFRLSTHHLEQLLAELVQFALGGSRGITKVAHAGRPLQSVFKSNE